MTIILGIKITDKENNAVELQKILTEFNCIIKLRIGINNTAFFCSPTGIILLAVEDGEKLTELEKELIEISGIELQRMVF